MRNLHEHSRRFLQYTKEDIRGDIFIGDSSLYWRRDQRRYSRRSPFSFQKTERRTLLLHNFGSKIKRRTIRDCFALLEGLLELTTVMRERNFSFLEKRPEGRYKPFVEETENCFFSEIHSPVAWSGWADRQSGLSELLDRQTGRTDRTSNSRKRQSSWRYHLEMVRIVPQSKPPPWLRNGFIKMVLKGSVKKFC